MSVRTTALSGISSMSFALILLGVGSAAVAQPDSTPKERAQTEQLNQDVTTTNAVADAVSTEKNAVYKAQQSRYEQQLQLYRAGQQNYQERAAAYLQARERYVASHARYHRAAWPLRSDQRLIVDTNDLLGANVHTADGRMIGHVEEIALASGRVSALRVTLDNNRGDAWIDSADLRFNADKRVVMTNLDRRDLYEMARDSY